MGRPPAPLKHGTAYGYQHCAAGPKGTRCEVCKEWNRARMRAYRGHPDSEGRPEALHGTRSMYKRCTAGPGGTKCDACRQANRDYQRAYMRLRRQGVAWNDPDVDRALDR